MEETDGADRQRTAGTNSLRNRTNRKRIAGSNVGLMDYKIELLA